MKSIQFVLHTLKRTQTHTVTQTNTTVMSAHSTLSPTSSWKHRGAKTTNEWTAGRNLDSVRKSVCGSKLFKILKRRGGGGGEHVEKNTLSFPPTEKHHVRKLRTVSKQEIKYCTIIRIRQHHHVQEIRTKSTIHNCYGVIYTINCELLTEHAMSAIYVRLQHLQTLFAYTGILYIQCICIYIYIQT